MLVSRIVAGHHDRAAAISPEVARRVHAAMQSLGYGDRDQPARDRHRTRRVLMLVCRMGSFYARMLVSQTQAALGEHGLLLTVQEGEGADDINRAIRMLEDGHKCGLIVETDDETTGTLTDLATRGYPIVAIGPKCAGSGHDVISADDSTAIREAMLHLVDRGFERFVLVSPRSDSNRDDRTTVARDQLRALGVAPQDIQTRYSGHDAVDAFAMALPVVDDLKLPVAFVSGSDSCAVGILWACLRAGVRVPEDVAILGHGNSPESEITCPPLSTIGPERRELRRAADLLNERIEHPSLPGRHFVEPWRFYPRQST
jgi:LacI family transcriptional regulator